MKSQLILNDKTTTEKPEDRRGLYMLVMGAGNYGDGTVAGFGPGACMVLIAGQGADALMGTFITSDQNSYQLPQWQKLKNESQVILNNS